MQQILMDYSRSDAEAGFRLFRMELYNWGTFHNQVWHISPENHNGLLTGDIGSGKSTLVDALLTLLVPQQRIVYNKAAGALSRERTLYSYIRGEYKSEKDELDRSAKPVALRDENNYTVLLAQFFNQGLHQWVTLAEVFWLREQQRNPERFFVVSLERLGIVEHFSEFGSSMADLKKRLSRNKAVEIFTQFKDYYSRFRNLFGIENPKALELFYQAVSMKSVGNLTDFVRQHMLEKSNVENRLDEMRRAFENLSKAHEAILKAKRQIELLDPLVASCEQYSRLSRRLETFRESRELLSPYFALQKTGLLAKRIEQLGSDIRKSEQKVGRLRGEKEHLDARRDELKTSIAANGGGRLEEIHKDLRQLEKERDAKRGRAGKYHELAGQLVLGTAASPQDFFANAKAAEQLKLETERSLTELDERKTDAEISFRSKTTEHNLVEKELESLRNRKSNIPLRILELRNEICEVLQIPEETLPCAGELLQVSAAAKEWEGAIERALHSFGLSLLVAEDLYAQVSAHVDRTHLRGRLVYYRVADRAPTGGTWEESPKALSGKLEIKADSPFLGWLEKELARQFDYICCDSLDEFRRLPNAITRNGQMKRGGRRHEKDDRHDLLDRSRFILGWNNEEKIRVLDLRASQLKREIQKTTAQISRLGDERKTLEDRRDCCRDLLQYQEYDDIDWPLVARRIETLEEESRQIEQSSDILDNLRRRLGEIQRNIANTEQALEEQIGIRARLEENQRQSRQELKQTQAESEVASEEQKSRVFPDLDRLSKEILGDKLLTLVNIRKTESELREQIRRTIDNETDKVKRLTEKIVRRMSGYKEEFKAETMEVDASVEAADEYRKMLVALRTEDLPRHEERFKKLLNEGTINSVALFQSQLDKEKQSIERKIDTINTSLREIEYDTGTYIQLVAERTQDPEIRDFQQELRQCLSHTLAQDDFYNEDKFLQVKRLIDRFNGRPQVIEIDQKWTAKVTDVRNWFTFAASERYDADNSEKEFFSDSSGKSGGQKEKLAYTILASGLAYQFGLEWGEKRSRSFRFVVIDEAFGRGSDESTRYGLELFKKLNLQLLIVTPLQKIHIIEDYIKSVFFIHNQDGMSSRIVNLSLQEYLDEKHKYQSETAGGVSS